MMGKKKKKKTPKHEVTYKDRGGVHQRYSLKKNASAKQACGEQRFSEPLRTHGICLVDNATGASREVRQALKATRKAGLLAYDNRRFAPHQHADEVVCSQFGEHARVFFVNNGSFANVFFARTVLRDGELTLFPMGAHPTDMEACAYETIAPGRGFRIAEVESHQFSEKQLERELRRLGLHGPPHNPTLGMLSLANVSERGVPLSVKQLRQIRKCCDDLGIVFHIDGARLFLAAAALGVSLKQLTSDVGVDLISLGFDKTGGKGCAMIYLGYERKGCPLEDAHGCVRRQLENLCAIPANLWEITVSASTLLTEDLGITYAKHAICRAKQLAEGLKKLGFKPRQHTNHVWVEMSDDLAFFLKEKHGHRFYHEYRSPLFGKRRTRFVTSFLNSEKHIRRVLADVERGRSYE